MEDQNFLKVKRYLILIFFFLIFSTSSFSQNLKFKEIVKLDEPWGSSFINENELIITEKGGKIKIVDINSQKISDVKHNLNYLEHGQGGLLDILYKDKFIYISYSENRGDWKSSTSIAKAKLKKNKLNFKNIFRAEPPINSGYHFGSRLAIKDNFLFASAGERGKGMIAQDPSKHPGSIIRIHLNGSISEIELLDHINKLNNNDKIHGFIVQLPLPIGIDEKKVVLSVNPSKDVDGFHPENMGRMALGLDTYLPATPYGIKLLLEFYDIETSGKNIVVIGRSHIVGLPMSILLGQNSKGGNATVTLTHSKTKDLEQVVKKGDIVISAIGKASYINADFIKKGAVVVDVGINKVNGKLKGDVDFDSINEIASAITPVPGGVGLMTRVGLLMNTLKAANEKN